VRLNFIFLWLAWISFPAFCSGQYFDIDTIKGQSPYIKGVNYIFPHLASHTNQVAADQINRVLMVNILDVNFDTDSGQQYKSIFEKVWGDTDRIMPSLSDISYEVINNDADVFCIGISAEGCGAYCEHWTRYFTFESKSGKGILLDELFSKDSMGLPLLLSSSKRMKNERINENATKLKASMNDKGTSADDKEYDRMALDMYSECKKDGGDSEYEELNFSLSKKQVTLYINPCLPHMIRALDDVDYTFVFELKDLKYLSFYAKSLLKL
jgi:hypothetical protein